jgi:hypothetical protein
MKLSEIEKLLKKYNIENYTIREDGLVDVDGDVKFITCRFSKLPIKFGHVTGDFFLSTCFNLTTLDGAPKKVGGFFRCATCYKLTSLEGGPEEVGNGFSCAFCSSLKSLKGAPTILWGFLRCYECTDLVSLEGAPTSIGGDFRCWNNHSLTSFKHCPQIIGGLFECSSCTKVNSLDYLPKQIDGDVDMSYLVNVKNYLAVFKIKGIEKIKISNLSDVAKILNKYIKQRDIIGCQDELIEAGFEEYARTK